MLNQLSLDLNSYELFVKSNHSLFFKKELKISIYFHEDVIIWTCGKGQSLCVCDHVYVCEHFSVF